MQFAEFIENFLVDLVRTYKDYFKKTYVAALIFALFTVIGVCLLLLLASTYDLESIKKYFFSGRVFSYNITVNQPNTIYEYTDLAVPLFFVFVSFFTIGFQRATDFDLGSILKGIRMNDFWNILIAFIIIFLADILIYNCNGILLASNGGNINMFHSLLIPTGVANYMRHTLSYIRQYFPILVLAYTVSKCLHPDEIKVSIKALTFVAISAFLLNAIRYMIEFFADYELISPFLWLSKNKDTRYIIEIFTSIPIIAIFFLDYSELLSYPLRNYSLRTSPGPDENSDENQELEISSEID